MSRVSSFDELRDYYADFFGRAAALYNINPLLGRLYAYLLLSPDPMTLDDLMRIAGAAKSTVSVAMKRLEQYRFVRRQWTKGDRRDYFSVRMDISEVLKELYQLYFSRELKYMAQANSEAVENLQYMQDKDGWPDAEERQALLARLDTLSDFTATVTAMLEQLMEQSSPSPRPSQSIPIEVDK